MPFTLAHPAAVMPLRRLRYLAVIPLVVGSLVPDLIVFFFPNRLVVRWPISHSLYGSFSVDLWTGYGVLLALLILQLPLTAPLWEPHRTFVRNAIAQFFSSRIWWLTACPSLLIGSWTHLVWDSFTHKNRWAVRHAEWLQYAFAPGSDHPMEVYRLLQYVCSVIGLAVIGVWYQRSLRSTGLQGTGRKWRKYLLASLVLASILIGVANALAPWNFTSFYRLATVASATAMVAFFALYVLAGLSIAGVTSMRSSLSPS